MWLIVMFDLPVLTKIQRKEATKFRNILLDNGFEMAQFSVYFRFCASKEAADKYQPRIENFLPAGGKVQIIMITDKQYEKMITYNKTKKSTPKKREQLILL